jgi:hypothetical protein
VNAEKGEKLFPCFNNRWKISQGFAAQVKGKLQNENLEWREVEILCIFPVQRNIK